MPSRAPVRRGTPVSAAGGGEGVRQSASRQQRAQSEAAGAWHSQKHIISSYGEIACIRRQLVTLYKHERVLTAAAL